MKSYSLILSLWHECWYWDRLADKTTIWLSFWAFAHLFIHFRLKQKQTGTYQKQKQAKLPACTHWASPHHHDYFVISNLTKCNAYTSSEPEQHSSYKNTIVFFLFHLLWFWAVVLALILQELAIIFNLIVLDLVGKVVREALLCW